MGLLDRFRESSATRCVQVALDAGKPSDESVAALHMLAEIGTERCVPVLCDVLVRNVLALQIPAARALTLIYKRQASQRILEALHSAALNERQPPQARQAAVESLGEVVDVHHARGLVEVLESSRSPVPVRSAALRCLKRLGYSEILERLVESAIFGPRLDPRAEIRRWAVHELIALEDREKLNKLHEIILGRRKLRYRAVSAEAGGPGTLIALLAEVDSHGALPYLEEMHDHDNPALREAATRTLGALKAAQSAPAPPSP